MQSFAGMSHPARDRRIHRVYVTRNTEYHVRRNRIVAVLDRRTGTFDPYHAALFRKVGGAIGFHEHGFTAGRTLPSVGESLLLEGTGTVTSPVVAVERPPRELVLRYPIVEAD